LPCESQFCWPTPIRTRGRFVRFTSCSPH
jgi:hypothetical protein